MQIPSPSEADELAFRSMIPDHPSVQVKPMFGNLGAFVNGNMFAGLFGPALGVRLIDEESKLALAAVDGTGTFGPAERPMGGYIAVPEDWSSNPGSVSPWLEKALEQVGALPAKVPKPRPAPKARR